MFVKEIVLSLHFFVLFWRVDCVSTKRNSEVLVGVLVIVAMEYIFGKSKAKVVAPVVVAMDLAAHQERLNAGAATAGAKLDDIETQLGVLKRQYQTMPEGSRKQGLLQEMKVLLGRRKMYAGQRATQMTQVANMDQSE